TQASCVSPLARLHTIILSVIFVVNTFSTFGKPRITALSSGRIFGESQHFFEHFSQARTSINGGLRVEAVE
ncbi:MAG: hypothetical protein ACR2G4_09520, partial [Pyrinomonadaceae bacterium]